MSYRQDMDKAESLERIGLDIYTVGQIPRDVDSKTLLRWSGFAGCLGSKILSLPLNLIQNSDTMFHRSCSHSKTGRNSTCEPMNTSEHILVSQWHAGIYMYIYCC